MVRILSTTDRPGKFYIRGLAQGMLPISEEKEMIFESNITFPFSHSPLSVGPGDTSTRSSGDTVE